MATRPPSLALRFGIFALATSLFGCDHATKIAAKDMLEGGRTIAIYDGIVDLRFAPNPDTAFSLLAHLGVPKSPALLLGLAIAALLAVLVAWAVAWRKGASTLQHAGFALVVAGALGNVVDRAIRGYVVDFIHIGPWPIFNVADIVVVVGVGLLLLASWHKPRDADRHASA